MLDVFNTAKPTGCDIQTFYGAQGKNVVFSWVKPRGVSNIYILLIGGGGNGDGSATGGGSGAVSVWYGAASNVPDNLRLNISTSSSTVQYYTSSVSTLLTALASVNTTGAAASAATAFTASGFYKSTAGQDGSTGMVGINGMIAPLMKRSLQFTCAKT